MPAAVRQPPRRLEGDRQRHQQQERALGERRQVLGLAVAVVVLLVGRADRHPHREQREQRGHEVGARVDRLGHEGQRAGGQAGGQLDRHQERGRRDADQRRASHRPAVGGLGHVHILPGGRNRLATGPRRRPFSCASSSFSLIARAARPRWLMASFSSGLELGHRPLVAGVVVGHEGRVVAEAAAAARLVGERSLAAAVHHALPAAGLDVGDRADVRHAGVAPGRDLGQQLGQVLLVARVLTGVARRPHPRRPAQRGGLDARVVGERGPAGGRGGRARLGERVLREGRARLRRERHVRRQRLELDRQHDLRQLAQLVVVAGGEDEPHGPRAAQAAAATASCWAARSSSMPAAARASSSSSDARDSGVRSAVACTSTSPPSPVITTLASTSAWESSE